MLAPRPTPQNAAPALSSEALSERRPTLTRTAVRRPPGLALPLMTRQHLRRPAHSSADFRTPGLIEAHSAEGPRLVDDHDVDFEVL